MTQNIGNIDRIVRIVLGLVIIGLGVGFQTWWGLLGAPFLISGIVGYCGLYTLLGISTCKSAGQCTITGECR